jgi:hypothetical protein
MKSATVLPSRKIVPEGEGRVVKLKPGYTDIWISILFFHETAWLRYLISSEPPTYGECLDDLNAHPGKWVCIGQNR